MSALARARVAARVLRRVDNSFSFSLFLSLFLSLSLSLFLSLSLSFSLFFSLSIHVYLSLFQTARGFASLFLSFFLSLNATLLRVKMYSSVERENMYWLVHGDVVKGRAMRGGRARTEPSDGAPRSFMNGPPRLSHIWKRGVETASQSPPGRTTVYARVCARGIHFHTCMRVYLYTPGYTCVFKRLQDTHTRVYLNTRTTHADPIRKYRMYKCKI